MANPTVSIEIKATDPVLKSTKTTITNVNPEATNAKLIQLAQSLNALTNNTYEGTTKITKEVLI